MLTLFRKKQKILLALFLVMQLFVTSAIPAQAGLFGGGPSIPSASSVMSDIEKRFHLDTGALQNQGENFNVTNNKRLTPEVSLFFNPSDPKPGAKITAKAFPMYFSNSETNLYYTWYLERKECPLKNSGLTAQEKSLCDLDGDGHIRVNDWKIAAAEIIVQNGYDTTRAASSPDSDDDGYRARFGGDNKQNTPDHCYINDSVSGTIYELVSHANDTSYSCPGGTSPVCMVGEGTINPINITIPGSDPSSPTSSTTGPAFSFTDTGVCHTSGVPSCFGGGPVCTVGSARCVANSTTTTSCGSALSSCSADTSGAVKSDCQHLFPEMPGFKSGDGVYGKAEEVAWGSDPSDPDTANNGNKDEANLVGLGQSSLTWSYSSGDRIGVVVEGTSMLPTKHDDASTMIMWAFSKKDCPVSLAENRGAYYENIKGYQVNIPTAEMNLDKCLERNLVDPAQGGQSTNLDVSVEVTPNTPINDETVDKAGDLVVAQASVSNNSNTVTDMLFDWSVEMSNNEQFRNGGGLLASNITADLQTRGVLGNAKGIALDALRLKLDFPNTGTDLFGGHPLSSYLLGGVSYLRFTAKVSENFTSGVVRKGKSDVVLKFNSSGKKITAYKAVPTLVGGVMRVALPAALGSSICNIDPVDRSTCRVIKNEIIGLRIDPAGLSNFNWLINGAPLLCSKGGVSPNCRDGEQTNVNFFPITGNVGDSYTVTVTANDVTSAQTVTLSRTFHIIEPSLFIEAFDKTIARPKFLGQYTDLTGTATDCTAGVCNDYSETVFQAFSGDSLKFRATFLPSFVGLGATRQWSLDGVAVTESAPSEITFIASKPASDMYNLALSATVVQPNDTRRALLDTWGISQLDSPELHLIANSQVEMQESGFSKGPLSGSRKYLAAIASYIPASIMFSFRIMLSVALIIFTSGFLFSLIPERRAVGVTSFPPRGRMPRG